MLFRALLLSSLLPVDIIVAQWTDCTVCPDGVTPPPDLAKPLPVFAAVAFVNLVEVEPTCGGMGEFLIAYAVKSGIVSSCADIQKQFVVESSFDFGAYCGCSGTEGFVSACGGPFCEDGQVFAGADVIAGEEEDSSTITCGEAQTFYQFSSDATECAVFDDQKKSCCGTGAASETDTGAPLWEAPSSRGRTLSLAFAASVMLFSSIF